MLRIWKTHMFWRAYEIAIEIVVGFDTRQSTAHGPESDLLHQKGT